MSLLIAFRHRLGARVFDVRIEAPGAGVTVLFGPSGAGKSTIAAVAAGLLRPPEAEVRVAGVTLADTARSVFVPPERRRIGTVFQNARLFPHLSVAANLRYGLDRASPPRPIGWDEVIGLLGIGDLLARRPATLSGGEQQRVAIGRALLSQPLLLIMDEPLASLDAARRAEILPYLARLRDTLRLPILYVTHALEEVVRLADTLVLIEAGRVTAAGPLRELASRSDLPLARRDDAGAVLECTVAEHFAERRLTRLAIEGDTQSLLVPLLGLPQHTSVRVRVPASEVMLATQKPEHISVQNMLAAVVHAIGTEAGVATLELRLGKAALLACITPDAVGRLGLVAGSAVLALVKSTSVQVLG